MLFSLTRNQNITRCRLLRWQVPQQHHDTTPDKTLCSDRIFQIQITHKSARLTAWLRCVTLPLLLLSSTATASNKVVYPAGEIAGDTRYRDVIELLTTALEKTRPAFGAYTCQPSQRQVPKKRVIAELASDDRSINVLWNPGSAKLEQDFLTIKIPLRKGLLGYRVMLIRKDKQAIFENVRTLQDLKTIRFGQGTGWIDNTIFQHQDLPLVEAPYPQLFAMLDADRFDAFPRVWVKFWMNWKCKKKNFPNLTIEKNLLLCLPVSVLFLLQQERRCIKTPRRNRSENHAERWQL
jgi:hypothetical protein